ncbi:MAG: hypothetical protein ACRDND_18550, partial [Streptosporangiaceae bacterium]
GRKRRGAWRRRAGREKAGGDHAEAGGPEEAGGDVRPDVGYLDVKALPTGCPARGAAGIAALDPVITVICQGLRPEAGGA